MKKEEIIGECLVYSHVSNQSILTKYHRTSGNASGFNDIIKDVEVIGGYKENALENKI